MNQLARQAHTAAGGVDVEPVTDEQMTAVMAALTRAVDQIDAITATATATRAAARANRANAKTARENG